MGGNRLNTRGHLTQSAAVVCGVDFCASVA
jgi:hypothetical protein